MPELHPHDYHCVRCQCGWEMEYTSSLLLRLKADNHHKTCGGEIQKYLPYQGWKILHPAVIQVRSYG